MPSTMNNLPGRSSSRIVRPRTFQRDHAFIFVANRGGPAPLGTDFGRLERDPNGPAPAMQPQTEPSGESAVQRDLPGKRFRGTNRSCAAPETADRATPTTTDPG